MQKFLKKLAFWMVPVLILHLILGLFADGNTDDNYRHFTSQASSIIIGDSRGAQAMVPSVLDPYFKDKKFDNFSLNIVHSPYGPTYLKALKRKISPGTKDGVFILTVSPWNLSVSKNVTSENEFPELESSPLRNMYWYGMNPNYEYLLKNLNGSWFSIFRDRETVAKSNSYLHKDGWLEVTISMKPEEIEKRTEAKVKDYTSMAKEYHLSGSRLQSLEHTIDFLKGKGKVYLVRIPTSAELMKIEEMYSPKFNIVLQDISSSKNIPYFDFSKNNKLYQYTDGNHMYKKSSKVFTARVADSIVKNRALSK